MPVTPLFSSIIQANTTTSGEQVTATPDDMGGAAQSRPNRSIAMAADGSFAVCWSGQGDEPGFTSRWGTYVRFFNADGTAASAEILVNSDVTFNQLGASIALLSNGNYIVSWSDNNTAQPDNSNYGTYAQIFQPNGTRVGGQIQLNTYISGLQYNTSIATSANGNFVATWVTNNQPVPSGQTVDPVGSANDFINGIRAQVFDSSGNPIGNELLVNTYVTSNQLKPTVSMADNGLFVVIWESQGQDDVVGVYGQRFNAAGAPQGSEFRVNETLLKAQKNASVAMAGDGSFVVVWMSDEGGLVGNEIYARRYDASGAALGGEFRVLNLGDTTGVVGNQRDPMVTITNDGGFIVTWTSDDGSLGDTSGTGVYARRFNNAGVPIEATFLVNSGDTLLKQENASIATNASGDFLIAWTNQNSDPIIGSDVYVQGFTIPPSASPVLTPLTALVGYSENAGAVFLDNSIVVTDADSTDLQSATITIGGFVLGEDALVFTNQNGISGSFNAGTGVLSLTGQASIANYETALRSITYINSSDNPSTNDRTVAIALSDGVGTGSASRTIKITAINDKPSLSVTNGTLIFAEDGPAVVIDPNISITDADDEDMTGATITVNGFVAGEDTLEFTNQGGISGTISGNQLTLSGTATKALYETALRSITFLSTSNPPTPNRTIDFVVNDGTLNSSIATRTIQIAAVDDPPVVTTTITNLSYLENTGPQAIDTGLTVNDVDSPNLTGAKVKITNFIAAEDVLAFTNQLGITGTWDSGTGELTLSGTTTFANYQTALRSVTYTNSSANPTAGARILQFTVNDGNSNSSAANRTVDVTLVNDPPLVVPTPSPLSYTEDDGAVAIDDGLTLSDPDSTLLQGATVTISGVFPAEDTFSFVPPNSIVGTFNVIDATTVSWTLTGSASVADYQAALRAITYTNNSSTPDETPRTVKFTVTDDTNENSQEKQRLISVKNTLNAPKITTDVAVLDYNENVGALVIDTSLTVTDIDSPNLASAKITIGGYVATQDLLSFTNQLGIVGSWDAALGVLTLTGDAPIGDWQTALRTITYTNSSANPTGFTRTIRFQANDGVSDGNTAPRTLKIIGVNNRPVVTTAGGSFIYTENAGAVFVDGLLTVTDVDNTTLTSATVTIDGYVNGEDTLSFITAAGIVGSFDTSTGITTFTGTASLENYEATLRSLKYTNSSSNPTATIRTIKIKVDDGIEESLEVNRGIQVTANTPPVLTPTAATLTYLDNQGAAVIDGGLAIADIDSINLASAKVTIIGYIAGEDVLSFTDQLGLAGNFNTTTGVLTITGTSGAVSLGNYQTALRSITYTNSNPNPAPGTRNIQFLVNDGVEDSNIGTRPIQIVVNAAPVINTSATPLNYAENQGAAALTTGLNITDSDSTNLVSATVTLAGYVAGEDSLGLGTLPTGITGGFDATTGVISLTGTAPLATYAALLATLTYTNSSSNPTTTTRTLQIVVNDGVENSATATRSIQIAANAAPSIILTPATLVYTEGQGALAIDNALTVTDTDSSNLTGATITIGSYVASEDALSFTDQLGITGSFNPTTGVLTLTGTTTLANYQTALRSIAYTNSSSNPTGTTRAIEFQVNDGAENSSSTSRTIQVNTVNSPPTGNGTGTALNYNENAGAVVIDAGVTIADPDSLNLTGATIKLTGYVSGQDILAFPDQPPITGTFDASTGILTLTGTATVAQYQAALQSITYANTSNNPATTPRQTEITITDGTSSNTTPITRSIVIIPVNTAPSVVATSGSLLYTENVGSLEIDTGITVNDPDNATLTGATVTITNFVTGQDVLSIGVQNGISGTFNAGTLTLTGTSSVANYQTALRSITYRNNSANPDTTLRNLSITVTDGTATSAATTRSIQITAVNNPPVLVIGSSEILAYSENAGAVAIDGNITVGDADSANLVSATIALVGYIAGQDSLGFTPQNGISGAFNTTTGVLSLTGSSSVANYQAALRSVTYTNSSSNPNTSDRTLRIIANDGNVSSDIVSRTIRISLVNTAPTVVVSTGSVSYGKNAGAVVVDSAIVVSDADSPTLTSATITLNGYINGEDRLEFTNQNGINGSFNATTGVLTLSGSASVSAYQVALRSITYNNLSSNPTATSRTVQFIVNDGNSNSTASSRTLQISQSNTPPTVALTNIPLSYPEQSGAVAIDASLFVLDSDSANLTGATITLSGYVAGQDNLLFNNQNGISGSFNAATGVMTLTGTASVANYQTALRSLVYLNTSTSPVTTNRSVQFTVTDGTDASNLAVRNIQVTSVNDAPTVTIPTQTLTFSKATGAVAITPNLVVSDPDSATLTEATITLGGYVAGQDSLIFADQNGITGSFNAVTGVLSLTGTATVALYQVALRSLIYSNNSDSPATNPRTVSISVTDGISSSNAATANVQIQFENSFLVPVLDLNGTGVGIDFSSTFVIGGEPVAIAASDAKLTGQNNTIVSAQIRISNLLDGQAEELLVDTTGTDISAAYSNGVLNLTGTAALASYLQVLRTVKYQNRLENPDRATRVILLSVNDGNNSSEPAQTTVQVTQVNLNAIETTPATDVIYAPSSDTKVISTLANLQQNDTIDGGAGTDTLVLTNGTGTAWVRVSDAANQVTGILTGITKVSNFECFDFSGFSGTALMFGSDGLDDDLIGGKGNDEIHGGAGSDRLIGNSGNDLIDGGSGNDTMNGGAGDDTYQVDSLGDVIVEGADTGFDTVKSSVTQFNLGTNLENLILIGNAVTGIGNDLSNDITGNGLGNKLTGAGGDDIIIAGGGKDTLMGDNGSDRLDGGTGKDRLIGGSGDDQLTGGRGQDRLTGRQGKDTFYLDSAKRRSRDTITDFRAVDDTIIVARLGFSEALQEGAIAPNQLAFGSQAQRQSDRFVYNQSTGDLFFDADGTGVAAQIWIARLANRTAIGSADIVVGL